MDLEANKRVVEKLWEALYAKDWEGLGALLHDDAFYEDVPAPDPGARFEHHFHRIVAEGETVVLEHTEVWHFHTGEVVRNPFVTIHEVADGRIRLWRDYWDLNTLMSSVPTWWIEHLAKFSDRDFA
jgi:ketosteroid isomerase-like protein